MTTREESKSCAAIKEEFRYRDMERLGIDSEGHEPRQDQRSAAFIYARETTEALIAQRRPKSSGTCGDLFEVMREAVG